MSFRGRVSKHKHVEKRIQIPKHVSRAWFLHKEDQKTLEGYLRPLGEKCGFEFEKPSTAGGPGSFYTMDIEEFVPVVCLIRGRMPDFLVPAIITRLINRIVGNRTIVFNYYDNLGQSKGDRDRHNNALTIFKDVQRLLRAPWLSLGKIELKVDPKIKSKDTLA